MESHSKALKRLKDEVKRYGKKQRAAVNAEERDNAAKAKRNAEHRIFAIVSARSENLEWKPIDGHRGWIRPVVAKRHNVEWRAEGLFLDGQKVIAINWGTVEMVCL